MGDYVDIHCHGGGGGDFCSADPEQIRTAARHHARHGSQRLLASLVTDTADALASQARVLAEVVDDGDTIVGGIHLEGPFLSGARCGAQNPAHLQLPDLASFDRWLASAGGHLRMITVAPELPGALELIGAAVEAGVVAAIGHTDATYEQAMAGFEAGASVATHLFNGMRPLHHRDPGPVGAALDAGAWVELIADGVHLHPATLRMIATTAPQRSLLVTDAMSATGLPDGRYTLGGQDVTVAGGAARLTRNGSLAGSTLTMDAAVAHAIDDAGLDADLVARMAREHPRAAVGL